MENVKNAEKDNKDVMLKKRLAATVFLLALFILLPSCEKSIEKNDGISIVTTVFPQYDFANKITEGTNTSVTMLIPAGTEAHSYDPTPLDIIKVTECDLFIWVGGESEAWAEKIINSAELDKSRLLALMDTVSLLECADGHGDDHTHEHSDGVAHDHMHDEHVWTSPKNAIAIVTAITEKL